MGGRNEQENLRSINKPGDRSIFKVKVKISSQSSIKCTISEPHPENLATNEMDYNADTCCLVTNFIVMNMKERTSDVYPYDDSYETMYNVPIVTGALTCTYRNKGTSFIIVINEALYYGKKIGHSLINSNQLQLYRTMV